MRPGLRRCRLGQKQKMGYPDNWRLAFPALLQVSQEASKFSALICDVFIGLLRFFQSHSVFCLGGKAQHLAAFILLLTDQGALSFFFFFYFN